MHIELTVDIFAVSLLFVGSLGRHELGPAGLH